MEIKSYRDCREMLLNPSFTLTIIVNVFGKDGHCNFGHIKVEPISIKNVISTKHAIIILKLSFYLYFFWVMSAAARSKDAKTHGHRHTGSTIFIVDSWIKKHRLA